MGLDMYLRAKKYVSGYSFGKEAEKEEYAKIIDIIGEYRAIADKDTPSGEIAVTAMYWRKANAIHNWFVENVQNGVDNCGTYPVSRNDLIALRETCAVVLAERSLAETLLPPTSGFFFGGTELDEWYWGGVQETHDRLGEILDLVGEEDYAWDFEYRSSW
ncbi:hypothetical protein UFOVP965_102 [uncultured Caudovirales phage]|uniref:Uncharacterized protein n=1 Tax=uncultured Caudovirales phage TaxID=2100421 RepID=A0A6J5QFK2_9CAUD|nr:hypothetical protein UFOVP965_102 [uncultured Caudovirales phage]CAB4179885.1 hypothetical protein UFOVP1035_98 [uncultured Caudovirales phage]CAB4188704.1 hypothetical protein UFOVP1181_57 [uncultured Caudovirales phage]